MNILFVDHCAAVSGAELSMVECVVSSPPEARVGVILLEDGPLCQMLSDAGVRVDVLEMPPEFLRYSHSSIFRIRDLIWGALRLSRSTGRLRAASRGFDVIVANTLKALAVAIVASLGTRARVVFYSHDILTEKRCPRVVRMLLSRALRLCTKDVIAVSHAAAAPFVARQGFRVQVVHPRFDPHKYRPSSAEEAQQAWREYFPKMRRSGVVIGCFGRLDPQKGQHLAIQSVAEIPGVTLLVAGAPEFGNEKYQEQLRALIAKSDLADRVVLMGGQNPAKIPTLIGLCDIVMQPSVVPEGFGRTLVEAMLCQKATIVAEDAAAREIVVHDETGLMVSRGDAQALAAAITWFLEHPDQIAAFGLAGRRRAIQLFGNQATEHPFYRALDVLLNPNPCRTREHFEARL